MITAFFAPKKKRSRPTDEDNSLANKKRSPHSGSSSAPSTSSSSTITSAPAVSPANSIVNSVTSSSSHVASLMEHFPSSDETISWRSALSKQLDSKKFESLAKFVAQERANKTIYPPPEMVFSALIKTPLHAVKVVIVGQDPYHQPSQGHGLSFSVPHSVAVPPSLRNIYKELINDSAIDFDTKPLHGNLERWAKQGVLLLNNVLTVRRGEAGSHSKKGWEEFTDAVIRAVVERDATKATENDDDKVNKGKGVVFLLWGKPASVKAQTVLAKFAGKNSKHAVITTSHPSPLGATKTNSPFLGSKCFSRANEELVKRGWEKVDWRVDGDLE